MKVDTHFFEDTGYCGVFDSRINLVWCDNTPLFKRLMQNKSMITSFFSTENPELPLHIMFRYDKKKYCALFHMVAGGLILCRIYPEAKLEGILADLDDEIECISCGALGVMNSISLIYNSVEKNDTEIITEYLKAQQREAESIYTECLNISNRFFFRSAAEFVMMREMLCVTLRKIERITNGLGKRFMCVIDILFPYVKIDYPIFEKAVYNLLKLFLKCGEGNAAVWFCNNDEKSLSVRCVFNANGSRLKLCDTEIRGVESVFSALGGESGLKVSGNKVEFKGIIPVSCTMSRKKAESANRVSFRRGALGEHELIFGGPGSGSRYLMSGIEEIEVPDTISYGDIILKSVLEDKE